MDPDFLKLARKCEILLYHNDTPITDKLRLIKNILGIDDEDKYRTRLSSFPGSNQYNIYELEDMNSFRRFKVKFDKIPIIIHKEDEDFLSPLSLVKYLYYVRKLSKTHMEIILYEFMLSNK
jgi:hypothetical protein